MSLGVIIFLIFLVLKLTHNIDWSWWWVLSPIFFEIGLDIVLFLLFVVFASAGVRSVRRRF